MGQASEAEPRDALGRLLLAFDRLVMPIFYRMNLKTDARAIVAGVVLGAVGLTAVLTVGPLTEANRQVAVTQAGRLATHIAREIAHRNSGFVAAGEFGKVDFGIATQSRSVRLAMLVDPSGRILAPARRANQLLSAGRESEIIIGALRGYTRGTNDSGVLFPVDPVTLLAVEPVRVLDSRLGRNVVAAASVVLLDLGGVEALGGDTGMLYSEALIYAGIIGLIAFLILIRLFLKPFEVLNEDIDRVLKGELPQVTHEFRFSPLDPLWDVINSALQRIPRSGGAGAGGGTNSLGLFSGAADPLAPIRALARATPLGMVVFDGERKVQLLNSPFEDLSGIRQDVALGKELGEVARDSALGVFVTDLLDRASAQGEAAESYEFSGVSYRLLAGALGSSPGKPEGYFLSAARGEG
jgi:PAS domain-containing protein